MTGTIRTKKTLSPRGDWVLTPEYLIDGRPVTREAFEAAFPDQEGFPGMTHGAGWPMASDALACHPEQVTEAMESAERKGVPTEFLPDGRPILRDRAHRRRYLKAYGFYDRDGGYGDG